MKTFADFVAWLEAKYPVGESTARALSVTGEPYVVVGAQHPDDGVPLIPGTVNEGCRHEWAPDEDTAVWQARNCFEQYAEGRRGTLYWRVPPRIDKCEKGAGIYMRLLISDKPVMRGSAS